MHDWQDKGKSSPEIFGAIAHGKNVGYVGLEKLIGNNAPLAGDAGCFGEEVVRGRRPMADNIWSASICCPSVSSSRNPVVVRPDAFD